MEHIGFILNKLAQGQIVAEEGVWITNGRGPALIEHRWEGGNCGCNQSRRPESNGIEQWLV